MKENSMFQPIKASLAIFALLAVLTGILYPLLITAAAQTLFPWRAGGSLITSANGQTVGSALIGQPFGDPKYFWGRLSATPVQPYNASASGGSNYSVLNEVLLQQAVQRITALHDADPGNTLPIPVDLVTASASGLDPHISPAAAAYQIGRVARIRGLKEEELRVLIQQNTEQPFLRLFGEPRVNVLRLNIALDLLQ